MSDKLPAIDTFDLEDPNLRCEIAEAGEFYEHARFIIVGYEDVIALSYGAPCPSIPLMVAWGSGYPHYECRSHIGKAIQTTLALERRACRSAH